MKILNKCGRWKNPKVLIYFIKIKKDYSWKLIIRFGSSLKIVFLFYY